MSIVARETPLALYKGLGAVLSGIVPKMAIRFASFEAYKGWLADDTGKTSIGNIFIGESLYVPPALHIAQSIFISTAGLGAGVTEAVAVVTPMEVVKIRLQAQQHSLADPLEAPRYRNAGHAVYTIVREEGFSALYRGVSLTALRQATNQGACYFQLQTRFVLCMLTINILQEPTSPRTKKLRSWRTGCSLISLTCLHTNT